MCFRPYQGRNESFLYSSRRSLWVKKCGTILSILNTQQFHLLNIYYIQSVSILTIYSFLPRNSEGLINLPNNLQSRKNKTKPKNHPGEKPSPFPRMQHAYTLLTFTKVPKIKKGKTWSRAHLGLESASLPCLVSLSAKNKKETSLLKGTW